MPTYEFRLAIETNEDLSREEARRLRGKIAEAVDQAIENHQMTHCGRGLKNQVSVPYSTTRKVVSLYNHMELSPFELDVPIPFPKGNVKAISCTYEQLWGTIEDSKERLLIASSTWWKHPRLTEEVLDYLWRQHQRRKQEEESQRTGR